MGGFSPGRFCAAERVPTIRASTFGRSSDGERAAMQDDDREGQATQLERTHHPPRGRAAIARESLRQRPSPSPRVP